MEERIMKNNLMAFLAVAVLLAGCAATEQGYQPVNPQAKNYAEALKSADKSC